MSALAVAAAESGTRGAHGFTGPAPAVESEVVIWGIVVVLLVTWLACLLLGKGGFIHILLLCAVALALVQWVAERRGRQEMKR